MSSLSLLPLCSLQFVVIKEHQNLRNGSQPMAVKDGEVADVSQSSSLEPGEWLSLPGSWMFSQVWKSHGSTDTRVKLCISYVTSWAVLKCHSTLENCIWIGFLSCMMLPCSLKTLFTYQSVRSLWASTQWVTLSFEFGWVLGSFLGFGICMVAVGIVLVKL